MSPIPNTISQRTVSRRQNQAFVGTPTSAGWLDRIRTGLNRTPQATKVITVTVTDPGDSTDIPYAVEDVPLTTNTGVGADAAAIAILIAADINASPGARALASAVASGDDVILTGTFPGVDFDFDDSDAALAEALTTAAASADAIGVGLAVIELGVDDQPGQPIAQNEFVSLVGLAQSALLTAQVDTLLLTFDDAVDTYVHVTVDGVTYTTSIAQATNADTAVIALSAALEFILPANTLTVLHPVADTLTFTAEVAGKPFVVGWGFGNGVNTGVFVHTSNAGALTDINRALFGVSVRPYDEETTTVAGTTLEYPANAGIRALEEGPITVENSQAVAHGDPVYLELGVSNTGQFFNTSGATRVLLNNARFRRSTRESTAELDFNFRLGNF